MTDPISFDNEGWIEANVPKPQLSKFNDIFNKKYNALDYERAEKSLLNKIEASEEHHRLFKAIVDGFSPRHGNAVTKSDFELVLVDPIYELSVNSAEILLAIKQVQSIHLCFVYCEIGGENYMEWVKRINTTNNVYERIYTQKKIKEHIGCTGLEIRSVQFITLCREIDLIEVDSDIVRNGTEPDSYAIWALGDGESPNEGSGSSASGGQSRQITHQEGHIEHPDLRNIATEGIDFVLTDNDDVKYSIGTHPIIILGEVFQQLFLDQHGTTDYPDEFDKADFLPLL
ncbi:hypothetical protein [Natronorarus salvus]|uniref:hypothetical protein n=1 Tax=Natronorarus salvus TaxID=3117733 RepID=UPI002F2606BD